MLKTHWVHLKKEIMTKFSWKNISGKLCSVKFGFIIDFFLFQQNSCKNSSQVKKGIIGLFTCAKKFSKIKYLYTYKTKHHFDHQVCPWENGPGAVSPLFIQLGAVPPGPFHQGHSPWTNLKYLYFFLKTNTFSSNIGIFISIFNNSK